MKASKELMDAARTSWHEHFIEEGRMHVDSYADDLYEAYLAGFDAGRKSVMPQTSNVSAPKE